MNHAISSAPAAVPAAPSDRPSARLAVVIPAFNEEAALPGLLRELAASQPDAHVIVVSDGSTDGTAEVARRAGATVLDLPANLGVGGAVQAGLRFARAQGHTVVARIDGDGQHPPSALAHLLDALRATGADLVVGSRFLGGGTYGSSTAARRLGIVVLAACMSRICRTPVTDPTSGLWCVREPLLRYFAHDYPEEYPEPEALVLLRRQRYRFVEAPAVFRPRQHGTSTIGRWGAVYFVLKVVLALAIDRVRPLDRRFANPAPGGVSA